MSTYRTLVDWVHGNRDKVLDLVRMYLGVGLFVRGVLFITTPEGIGALVDLSDFSIATAGVAAYVSFTHLLGGLMLAAGLLTRIAAVLQIPILTGAVFLVHLEGGLLTANQSLEFSALVLFLLVVVFLFGAGPWSADRYVFEREPELQASQDFEAWWREDAEEPPQREPVPAGDGEVAVSGATRTATESTPPVGTLPRRAVEGSMDLKECSCGNDLDHPRVTVEPRYGWTSGFFFMLGISAPVKEIIFYCDKCGTVMKRSRNPELLERYRWHTS